MIILHVHRGMSKHKSIRNASINRYGGYYSQGRKYSPSRIDSFHMFVITNDRNTTVNKFTEVSKILKRLLAINMCNSRSMTYQSSIDCGPDGWDTIRMTVDEKFQFSLWSLMRTAVEGIITTYYTNPSPNHKRGDKNGAQNSNPNPKFLIHLKRWQIAALRLALGFLC